MAHRIAPQAEADLDDIWYQILLQGFVTNGNSMKLAWPGA